VLKPDSFLQARKGIDLFLPRYLQLNFSMGKKIFGCICLLVLVRTIAVADPDEGMWLPLYLKQLNEKDMQAKGLKLTADDIYSINKSSLKDAVVNLGGFCTGEIVSAEGLMLTNHHCGYDKIAEHSTVEHDYLKDGFWAKTRAEELPNPGLTASILVYMEDVTKTINNALTGVSEEMKPVRLELMKDSIIKASTADNDYEAEVQDFFKGNEYYLLVYEVFKDVRLVGAPPSSIGKFGGETDNWMWPRHTGDFSIFRIYSGPDDKPAEYSTSNIPYKPKKFFKLSLKGEKQGDYAMILGYPGTTDRYLTSYDLALARDFTNPAIIEAFGTQLDIMKKDMDASEELKIALASDFASMSNTHKYYIGQERLLPQGSAIDAKRADEEAFSKWVNADTERRKKYGTLLGDIQSNTEKYKKIEPGLSYFFYGFFQTGTVKYAFTYYPIIQKNSGEKKATKAQMDSMAQIIKPAVMRYFEGKSYNTDRKVIEAILAMMYKGIKDDRPAFLDKIVAKYKAATPEESIKKYVDELYKKSALLNKEKAEKWLNKPDYKKLTKDPLIQMMSGIFAYYFELVPTYQEYSGKAQEYEKLYMQGLREWKSNKKFYPDANGTLRVTYGSVLPYFPRDGVFYKYYTTYEGIMEKDNPKDPEFDVPDQQLGLFKAKRFGKYAQNDTLRVNFLTNNDITGGNSGSPVIDANGNIIGLAFDGNWESMVGDLYVDPSVNRTICVDIRYVLWIIDEFAHADSLIKEMKIAE
jgi:hypothetical protein